MRLRHQVELTPLPRAWVEDLFRTAQQTFREIEERDGSLSLDGQPVTVARLTEGVHRSPGALYTLQDENGQHTSQLRLTAWDLESLRLEVSSAEEGLRMETKLELLQPRTPRTLRASTLLRGEGSWPLLRSGEVGAVLDLADWWASAAGLRKGEDLGPRRAPFQLTFRHHLARGTASVAVAPGKKGRWQVTVTARLHGRRWARPLVPPALRIARTRDRFRTALDDHAKQWNEQVPALLERPPHELREELRRELLGLTPEKSPDAPPPPDTKG
ncbi:hypothetical protein [Streptomyces sp. NPDC005438]|uniref:hypothetical protein n=1 Tax=Streptomyces sp. NPDC005438 TaxID=3156880 RepID=UPI00339FF9B0